MNVDALRPWLDERVASHEFSGVALVWRNGPIATNTRFGVASVTKMVSAATALRLVDRGGGELRLDQPLIEILAPEHRTTAMTAEHTLHQTRASVG